MDSNKKIILKKLTFFLLLTICLLSCLTLNFSQTANAQTTTNSYTVGGTPAVNDFYQNYTTFPLTNPPGTGPTSDIYNNLSYYYQKYYDTGNCHYNNNSDKNDDAVEKGWLSPAGVPTVNLEGSSFNNINIPYAVQYTPGTKFKFVFDLASVFCYSDLVGGDTFPIPNSVTFPNSVPVNSSSHLNNIDYMAYKINSATIVSGGGKVQVPQQTTTKLNFYNTQNPSPNTTIQNSIWYSHSQSMTYFSNSYYSAVSVQINITPYLKYVNPVKGKQYQCISDGGYTFNNLTNNLPYCNVNGTFTINFLRIFKPRFQIKNGDVVAGSTLQSLGCSKKDAKISGYPSSGSEYAAIATGTISNFVSGQGLYGLSTNPLTFSNFNNSGGNPNNYGGNFGMVPCLTNYFHPPSSSNDPNTYIINSTGPPYYSIPTNNQNLTIQPNQHYTYYVNGNVIINHNILLSATNNPTKIPSFNLIVKGNIYIDSNVTELDGLYEALETGNNGNNGNIYDCNTGTNSRVILTPLYPQCSQQLTFNGSVMAQNTFHLDRMTIPPNPQPNGPPAEIFNLSPLLWFDQINNNSSGTPAFNENNTQPQYSSLTSLPPIY